jgi:hypothetical protein
MPERRRLERFDLTAPAQLIVESDGGRKAQLDLTTKDVSSAGAYLYCPESLLKGANVRMELLICLDRLRKFAGQNGRAKIKVKGTIIRVDTDGIAIRFANKYKISALEDGDHTNGRSRT